MSGSSTPRLVASLYPALLAFVAGGAFVDKLYARAAANGSDSAARSVGDALLILALPVMAAGLLAAVLGEGRSRAFFVLSIAVFSLEFVLPALIAVLPGGVWFSEIGPFLRAAVLGGALLIALLGQREALR
jgi:hypothetical protein